MGWWFRDKPWAAVAAMGAVLLWPATWYVSAWWGQYESIYVLPAVLAVLAARGGRPSLVAALVALSLMTKPQALPFIVPFAAWFLATQGWRGTIKGALVGLLVCVLVWLPFIPAGGPANYLGNVAEYQDGIFNVLSLRAWNPWWIVQELAAGGDFVLDSTAVLGPVTFRQLGFVVAGLLAVVVFAGVYRRPSPQGLALGLAAITLVAFVSLTTMHERYAYPAFVFLLMAANTRVLAGGVGGLRDRVRGEPGLGGAGPGAVAPGPGGGDAAGLGSHHAGRGDRAAVDRAVRAARLRRRGAAAAQPVADDAVSAVATTPESPRRRVDRSDVVVGIAAVGAVMLLMWLGLGLTFFADEWSVIADRSVTLPGPRSPVQRALACGHDRGLPGGLRVRRACTATSPTWRSSRSCTWSVAILVYALVRRRTLRVVAVGIALVVLVFGSGFENLFWGIQIGFVGATALGFGALLLLDDVPTLPGIRRAVAADGSADGRGHDLRLRPVHARARRVRPASRSATPALDRAAARAGGPVRHWYLALGRAGVDTYGDPFTPDRLAAIPASWSTDWRPRSGPRPGGGATQARSLVSWGLSPGSPTSPDADVRSRGERSPACSRSSPSTRSSASCASSSGSMRRPSRATPTCPGCSP